MRGSELILEDNEMWEIWEKHKGLFQEECVCAHACKCMFRKLAKGTVAGGAHRILLGAFVSQWPKCLTQKHKGEKLILGSGFQEISICPIGKGTAAVTDAGMCGRDPHSTVNQKVESYQASPPKGPTASRNQCRHLGNARSKDGFVGHVSDASHSKSQRRGACLLKVHAPDGSLLFPTLTHLNYHQVWFLFPL